MIEDITNDVSRKLLSTTSKEFEDLVGIEDHIAEISTLLRLESEEVRMLGIWGSSGIGKTTIARALLNRFSSRFQRSIFIDMAFVSKSKNLYPSANADDYNLKSHLRKEFLSEILGEKDTKKEHVGALEERLKNRKVLIIIDDLDDPMVLDALVGQNHRFGRRSRIIMVTKDKHLLRARKVDCIYEVVLPSKDLSLKMLCRYAFCKDSPPDGLMELASEVALLAGNLPLGLKVLGSHLQGRNKEDCIDMLLRLRSGLDGRIGKTMRVSYDGLNNRKDKAIFRHIACFFNGAHINDIKELLANSDFDINIGLVNLIDKSLIQVRSGNVEMHCLLQEMGKEIVREESNDPGEREFLVDSKEICYVLSNTIGTKKILGISLDTNEIDELNVHEKAFESLHNLVFLNIYTKKRMMEEEERLHLPEGFNNFSPKLRLLCWDRYPISYMPSNFRPENLVKLQMQRSKLEKLWKGVCELKGLKIMDLGGSRNLMEIPNLSKATNLQILRLNNCSSLVELPSTIQYLNNLEELNMQFCENLEILPKGVNLESLDHLDLSGCSRLKSFPAISTNISFLNISQTAIEGIPTNLHFDNLVNLFMYDMMSVQLWKGMQPLTPLMTMLPPTLEILYLSDIPSLLELPSSIQNLYKLEVLHIIECTNLETLPAEINLEFLKILHLTGCSRLKSFPNISTNVLALFLEQTAIEEVPGWIENFDHLTYLHMSECNELKYVSLNIYKLEHLEVVDFSYCGSLTAASWIESPCLLAMETKNIHSKFQVSNETSALLPDNYVPKIQLKLSKCNELDEEAILRQQPWFFKSLMFLGDKVPPFFTHRNTGTTLSVPLLYTSLSQQFFKFKACAVVASTTSTYIPFEIQVHCWFIDRLGNYIYSDNWPLTITTAKFNTHLVIFECYFHRFPLNEDNAPLTQLSYDYVELEFFTEYYEFQIIGCGIRLPEDGPYLKSDRYGARALRGRRAPSRRWNPVGKIYSRLNMNRRRRKQMSVPRTPVRIMLSTFLTSLELSHIPILVETISSFQIPNNLKKLRIIYCMDPETLPEGINLKSLDLYYLTRCSRLQTFPDVSTNISKLYLSHTGIEEVPWWIKYLSHLVSMEMWKCNQLKYISPRIFQLDNIDVVSFSDCEQLAEFEGTKEAKGINNPLTMLIMFTNCFRLNQVDAFAQQSASMHLILPGVKVSPCVTNLSTGSFLTVSRHHSPLSQQSPLDFKACILLSEVTASHHQLCFIDIHVHYRFIDSHGNYFEPAEPSCFSLDQKINHLIMFDCHFPLNQEWDQVEIEFRHNSNRLRLKECCMPLSDDPTPFLVTWKEIDESKFDDDEGYATALSKEEWGGDSDDIGYETADDEEDCGHNTDNEDYDTALSEDEFGDNQRSY
ncbi:disease resistance protein RPS6-like [Brassica napus]|nr:disease resistance protein RPS6-like [Brassica napus]XP_048629183.1 disease resistance protein RPS6-like [Brassica napus]